VPQPELKNKPGKLGYMSPELFGGAAFDGKLCDTYSMGVILFIILTGVPPFEMSAESDARFRLIYTGQLRKLLQTWQLLHVVSEQVPHISFASLWLELGIGLWRTESVLLLNAGDGFAATHARTTRKAIHYRTDRGSSVVAGCASSSTHSRLTRLLARYTHHQNPALRQ
jgi:serine/threonine protein kinase